MRSRNRAARALGAAIVVACSTMSFSGLSAEAQGGVSNASLSRKLVDACVYDQFRRTGSSEGVVRACQCAARKAGPELQARQVERLQIGLPLTGDVRDEVYKALATCK